MSDEKKICFRTNISDSSYIDVSILDIRNFSDINSITNKDEASALIKLRRSIYLIPTDLIYEYKLPVSKDSLLAQFMFQDKDHFINQDDYISYDDVVNAYNVAIYDAYCKMANKILPLFRNREFGSKVELSKIYSDYVINYISENNDFKRHLNLVDGIDEKSQYKYILYDEDDGTIKITELGESIKVKSKTN